MRELLELKKREILSFEEEKNVQRILSDEPYRLVKKLLSQYKMFQRVTRKWTSANRRLKIIDARVQKDLVSNEEALRHLLEDELQQIFRRKKLVYYKTDFKNANKLYFPFWAQKGEFKTNDLFLKIDISKCFYSIYSLWGIDVVCASEIDHESKIINIKYIARGEFNKKNSIILQKLEREKLLRNTVYGLTRSAWCLKIFENGKIEKSFFRGKLQNLDLTVLISAILHYFISQIKKFVIYWNIDGGIIRAEGFERAKKIAEMLKLNLKVEAESNEAVILGLGSYKIGDYQTLHFSSGVEMQKEKIENIYTIKNFEEVAKWLRKL